VRTDLGIQIDPSDEQSTNADAPIAKSPESISNATIERLVHDSKHPN
jgi:hypothetical protein